MQKITLVCFTVVLVLALGACSFQTASAANLFAIVLDSQEIEGCGWFAGYVVYAQSDTYTLPISASGGQNSFPISNVKVIVCVSTEAAAGGLQSLTIEGTTISGFTAGPPSYYGANGGPFSEPDYYGYNDNYVIPQLSYNEAHHPESAKNLTINIQFSPSATQNSKVMFLCYGVNAQGNGLKTAFSTGTLIVPVPENGLGVIAAIGICSAAFLAHKKRHAKQRTLHGSTSVV